MLVDGQFDDWLIGLDSLDAERLGWSQNRLGYAGLLLDVEWLHDSASRWARDQVLDWPPCTMSRGSPRSAVSIPL